MAASGGPGGDPLRQLSPGDGLPSQAATYNAYAAAARDFQQRQRSTTLEPSSTILNPSVILVRNDSGKNLPQYSVLGLDGPLYDPAKNLARFKERIVFRGVSPTGRDKGKFCVILESCPKSNVVRAAVDGLVQVKVKSRCSNHQRLDVSSGTHTSGLTEDDDGSATAVWRAPGKGLQWAIVRLGLPCCLESSSCSSSSSSSSSPSSHPSSHSSSSHRPNYVDCDSSCKANWVWGFMDHFASDAVILDCPDAGPCIPDPDADPPQNTIICGGNPGSCSDSFPDRTCGWNLYLGCSGGCGPSPPDPNACYPTCPPKDTPHPDYPGVYHVTIVCTKNT